MPQNLNQMQHLVEKKSAQISNVFNTDQLKHWLSEIVNQKLSGMKESLNPSVQARQVKASQWVNTVVRKHFIKNGQRSLWKPHLEQEAPTWAQEALSRGEQLEELSLTAVERRQLEGVLDWIRDTSGPKLDADWSRMTFTQACQHEKAWINNMARNAEKLNLDLADLNGTSTWLSSIDAPGFEGWKWVKIFSKDALKREGALMRHCVGSYHDRVADGTKEIYSLRNPDNKPKLTIEAEPDGSLCQLKAGSNALCPEELIPAADAFMAQWSDLYLNVNIKLSDDFNVLPQWISTSKSGLIHLTEKTSSDFLSHWNTELIQRNKTLINPSEAENWWKIIFQLVSKQVTLSPEQWKPIFDELSTSVSDQSLSSFADLYQKHHKTGQIDPRSDDYIQQWNELLLMKNHEQSPIFNDDLQKKSSTKIKALDFILSKAIDLKIDSAIQSILTQSDSYVFNHALIAAIQSKNLELCQILTLRSDPCSLNFRALFEAVKTGDRSILEHFTPQIKIYERERLNGSHSENNEHITLLERACELGHTDIVHALEPLTGNDLLAKSFIASCKSGNVDLSRHMCAKTNAPDWNWALRAAVMSNDIPMSSWILKEAVNNNIDLTSIFNIPENLVNDNKYDVNEFTPRQISQGYYKVKDTSSSLTKATDMDNIELVRLLIPNASSLLILKTLAKICDDLNENFLSKYLSIDKVQETLKNTDLAYNEYDLFGFIRRGYSLQDFNDPKKLQITQIILPYLSEEQKKQALSEAIIHHRADIAQILLDAGVNPSFKSSSAKDNILTTANNDKENLKFHHMQLPLLNKKLDQRRQVENLTIQKTPQTKNNS